MASVVIGAGLLGVAGFSFLVGWLVRDRRVTALRDEVERLRACHYGWRGGGCRG